MKFEIDGLLGRELARLCAMDVAICNVKKDEFQFSLITARFYEELQELTGGRELEEVVDALEILLVSDKHPTIAEQNKIIFPTKEEV